jgi:RsiW-degrading membrane proteinase PrsW (M82 family)
VTDDQALRAADQHGRAVLHNAVTVEPPTAKAPTAEAPTAKAPTAKAPTAEAPTAEAPTPKAPTAQAPAAKAPRRWLGPRGGWWILLIGGLILATYLTYDAVVVPQGTNYRSLPVLSLALGAILAATCVFYTMLYRVRVGDAVTIPRLFAALAAAAFVATFAAAQAESQIQHWVLTLHSIVLGGLATPVSALFAGPVEETLKGLTVLLFGLGVRTKTLRGGLFLGGAVGLGFAATENLQYLVNAWEYPGYNFSQLGSVIYTLSLRTVITPLLHPVFTALLGGMLFAASRNGRYRLSIPLVGTFLAVVGAHSLWDVLGFGTTPLRGHAPPAVIGIVTLLCYALQVGIAIGLPFVWLAVARRAAVQAGIRPPKQRFAPARHLPQGPPPPAGWVPPPAVSETHPTRPPAEQPAENSVGLPSEQPTGADEPTP